MKQFFPDILYNKSKRRKYFALLALGVFLIGGLSVTFFVTGQSTIGLVIALFAVIALSTVPNALLNYPVKNKPLIEIDGKDVTLYGKEKYRMSEILAVSVIVDVPKIGKTKKENAEFLAKAAATRPEEPILGTCDILVRDAKNKEVTRYNIVYDCLGALEAFIAGGVKKYRILFSMKKVSVPAKFKINAVVETKKEQTLEALSEKERMQQLI